MSSCINRYFSRAYHEPFQPYTKFFKNNKFYKTKKSKQMRRCLENLDFSLNCRFWENINLSRLILNQNFHALQMDTLYLYVCLMIIFSGRILFVLTKITNSKGIELKLNLYQVRFNR